MEKYYLIKFGLIVGFYSGLVFSNSKLDQNLSSRDNQIIADSLKKTKVVLILRDEIEKGLAEIIYIGQKYKFGQYYSDTLKVSGEIIGFHFGDPIIKIGGKKKEINFKNIISIKFTTGQLFHKEKSDSLRKARKDYQEQNALKIDLLKEHSILKKLKGFSYHYKSILDLANKGKWNKAEYACKTFIKTIEDNAIKNNWLYPTTDQRLNKKINSDLETKLRVIRDSLEIYTEIEVKAFLEKIKPTRFPNKNDKTVLLVTFFQKRKNTDLVKLEGNGIHPFGVITRINSLKEFENPINKSLVAAGFEAVYPAFSLFATYLGMTTYKNRLGKLIKVPKFRSIYPFKSGSFRSGYTIGDVYFTCDAKKAKKLGWAK